MTGPGMIDPEDMLSVLNDGAEAIRERMGISVPDGFPAAVTSLLMIMADVSAGDCECEPCHRLRTTVSTLDSLR